MIDKAEQIAADLLDAMINAKPLNSLAKSGVTGSLAHAYSIQERRNHSWEASGARRRGWKIGLTSPAAQSTFGASEPMRGVLYSETLLPAHAEVTLASMCAPRLEGEIALRLGVTPGPDASDAELLDSLASVHAAFEIADSRIADWRVGVGEAIADNACCARFGIVDPGLSPNALDLTTVRMTIRDERSGEVLSEGIGANCLGSPIHAFRWLVRSLGPGKLLPGDLVMTGALGPMVPMEEDRKYLVDVCGLGSLSVSTTR